MSTIDEKIQAMTSSMAQAVAANQKLHSQLATLKSENERLREALEFYANETREEKVLCDNHSSYHNYQIDMHNIVCKKCGNSEDSEPGFTWKAIPTERSKVARAALNATQEGKG